MATSTPNLIDIIYEQARRLPPDSLVELADYVEFLQYKASGREVKAVERLVRDAVEVHANIGRQIRFESPCRLMGKRVRPIVPSASWCRRSAKFRFSSVSGRNPKSSV